VKLVPVLHCVISSRLSSSSRRTGARGYVRLKEFKSIESINYTSSSALGPLLTNNLQGTDSGSKGISVLKSIQSQSSNKMPSQIISNNDNNDNSTTKKQLSFKQKKPLGKSYLSRCRVDSESYLTAFYRRSLGLGLSFARASLSLFSFASLTCHIIVHSIILYIYSKSKSR
jgi:hypothetical protein